MAINQLQKGATVERLAWMAKVRVLAGKGQIVRKVLRELMAFGKMREKRTRSRKGGL